MGLLYLSIDISLAIETISLIIWDNWSIFMQIDETMGKFSKTPRRWSCLAGRSNFYVLQKFIYENKIYLINFQIM